MLMFPSSVEQLLPRTGAQSQVVGMQVCARTCPKQGPQQDEVRQDVQGLPGVAKEVGS